MQTFRYTQAEGTGIAFSEAQSTTDMILIVAIAQRGARYCQGAGTDDLCSGWEAV